MERIVKISFVLTVLIKAVYCQGLAIDFNIQTATNSSLPAADAGVSADSTSTDRLQINCRLANINNVERFDNLRLGRITKNGVVQNLAKLQNAVAALPGYQTPILESGVMMVGIQVHGSFSPTNPTLGISLPISSLTCNDAATYNCTLEYGYVEGSNYKPAVAVEEKNLTVTVKPPGIEMTAFNQSSTNFAGQQITDSGTESSSPAKFYIGQVIKITCKASLGSYRNGEIKWRKSNIVAGSSLANHIPNSGDHIVGEVQAVDGCQYQKTDSILYNMTDQDATRASNNPLQFQCYVAVQTPFYETPEATRKNFFLRVFNENEDPTSGGLATAGSGDAGVIAGAVIGSLVGIVIIVLLVYFLWYRRRAAGDDYTTKEEQGASNPNLAPEPQYAQSTKKGHENRAMDERTDSSHRYANDSYDRKDRHDRSDRNGQRGVGRRNLALDDDDEDYHSRDGSPTMNHSTHMGIDPEHGGIGTGV
ncbi:uncharacterized protein LOC127835197 isoform X2 [Dreissena polymorpha]|uniref:Ig-like domain-containing protein n=1 Tax=Dreissena polymorpha TaxID=45954 RepID=A0A9D4JM94_DREPO|nr:uncharacterized protein LOC127835197 isoform X2 [Dreissena polymorpha]KAH3815569.1 hypothetical protein DPMN_144097 [Dreissena polymorpha]